MKKSLHLLAIILSLFTTLTPSPAPAAIAPLTDKELDTRASVIVTGKVTAFTGTRSKEGTVEITLEVTSVKKGDIKPGTTLRIVTWSGQYVKRDEIIYGSQGLSPVPNKGDTVKAWLNLSGTGTSGNIYSTPHPNGVQAVPAPASGKK